MATTKKHFERAARIVREIHMGKFPDISSDHANSARDAFIELFMNDNPYFDVIRFKDACEIEEQN